MDCFIGKKQLNHTVESLLKYYNPSYVLITDGRKQRGYKVF